MILLELLKGAVIPLAIGATLVLLFAISHAAATAPGRKKEFEMVCRVGLNFSLVLLPAVFVHDVVLGLRATVFGFTGEASPGPLGASYGALANYISFYFVAFMVGVVLLFLSEKGRGRSPEYEKLQERNRKLELELERRQS